MRRIRVYVDTSVFGGTCDEEFAGPSRRFFERVRKGRYVLLVSRTTTTELEEAPQRVREYLDNLPRHRIEHVSPGPEVETLADAYIAAGALDTANRTGAIHVAAATVAGAELVLSWNFKHIVRYDRIRKFNGVNALNGYHALDIRSPLEVDYDDENQGV